MKARYLTFFSYIGSNFRASQKLWIKMGRNYPDPQSVQGIMEIALQNLKSVNFPAVNLSSRTDGGVHALNTTAHFDLERPGPKIYDSDLILSKLNNYFLKKDISIFINNVIQVDDNFSARRNAISRTYLYRFAVLQENKVTEHSSISQFIPVEEWKRCLFTRQKQFNIDKFREAAKYFEGYHDFTTFKKFDKMTEHKHNRRHIYSINVRPGQPAVTSYTAKKLQLFEYWDVEIKGHSFVHNQIRRMIGSLIAVAAGKIEQKDIKLMLQIPSKHSWYSQITSCSPNGLYLCNVDYKSEDLIYKPEDTNNRCN